MSERRENEEQEVKEYEEEEEDTDTNVETGGNTVEQPAEDDREPGRRGEEEQEDRTTPDVLEAAEEAEYDLQDGLIGPVNTIEVGNSVATDVLETVEEAETQADLSHDAEQLGEPQRTEHVGNSTATVKVVLVPEGHVMTVAFAIGLSIAQLKLHLANELRVPADVLHIFLDGRAVDEQQSLMELGVRPNGSTRMEMSSIDPDSHPLRPLRPPEQDNMPDVITVRVQTEENMFREVVVEIERPPQQKAFLGGFKHRLTGAQYHHAAMQTLPKRRADRGVVLFSRNTQTVELQSEAQQCPLDASTQMTGIGCYVSCMDDKLVAPGNYITADQYHEERLRAVSD
ncbi:IQ and ubiquitin-like domain-containing protein [Notothenia coriiceps]|uniref:IQ and ubiquitin-like domain-containing protein n=1 Tax=Notothenia coriiceps TaxID=8208 RepID=A0A6I9NS50_9TELE|nr:PREDICTED: IQ and ubiquitin-like domain-containing protein [Notothenia coriiceps]